MFKGVNKIASILAATAMIAGCTTEAERRHASAEQLHADAVQLNADADFAGALVLLDSLDTAYREQTEVRRAALATRAAAIEGVTIERIGPADRELAAATIAADSLGNLFTTTDGTRGLEGYTVAKTLAKTDVTASTGIQPRLDSDGYLTLACVVKGRKIGLHGASLTTASGTASVEPIGSDRRIDSEGSELAVLRQEELTPLLEALDAAGMDAPAKLFLDGNRGSAEVKLTPTLRRALLDTWHYALARQRLRSARIERERLERTLQTARDHRANS